VKYSSQTLERLIQAFTRLPGIGEKSAQRIALYLLREEREEGESLANSILDLKDRVGKCSICFNFTEEDPCTICQDSQRDHQTICVVEEQKDLLAIERTGEYNGLYHVLGGCLSPLEGIGEDDLTVSDLLKRIESDIKEVILATNPTVEGEMTAARLNSLLQDKSVRITRIARGVPFGGSLEFNDAITVAKALEGRTDVSRNSHPDD
jgi:recombination protein RecR